MTKHLHKSKLQSYLGSKTGPRFSNGITWGSNLDSIFFSRIPKKMLVHPTGILHEDHQDYKKKKKNWDSVGFYKKSMKRFWDSTEKLVFGFQVFSHRIPRYFSGILGFWTKKSTIFVVSATLNLLLNAPKIINDTCVKKSHYFITSMITISL